MQLINDISVLKMFFTAGLEKNTVNRRNDLGLERALKQEDNLKRMEKERGLNYKRYFLG